MRKVFLVLAGLMLFATVALLFFAGVGAFDSAPRTESFEPHRMLGRALFVVSLLAIVAAALARLPGRLIGLTALITGLVFLQSLIAIVSRAFEDQSTATAALVFGLHAVNGLVTMGVARVVFARARALTSDREPAAVATP
jgi:hypothetical protein